MKHILGLQENRAIKFAAAAVMKISMRGLVIIIMATVSLLMIQCDATLHTVGGTRNNGWKPNLMNYTSDWASHEEFYVGDWLYWGFSLPKVNRDLYSVYEVNKTDYESCSSGHVIAKVSRGAGRDVWELKEPRPYYFISGGGYCRQGMKLAVFVKELPPPPPAKAPWKSGAPKLLNFSSSLFTTVAAAAALAVLKLGVHD